MLEAERGQSSEPRHLWRFVKRLFSAGCSIGIVEASKQEPIEPGPVLVVLFTDIVDSTQRAAALGDMGRAFRTNYAFFLQHELNARFKIRSVS